MAITVEDVRLLILDTHPDDNPLDMDLSFGDDAIKAAMQRAVMAFNELPPHSMTLTKPEELPHRAYLLHGIVKYLYLAELARLARNRIEYQAGNMTADPDAARVKFFTEAIKMHGAEFTEGARSHKIEVNLKKAYGSYC